ncbi:MAG: L,D-transpeptidase family protein [Flavobacteriales bacterium]|nr:L,D-transpeptidase family protein [Flavobacteriales bacterium]
MYRTCAFVGLLSGLISCKEPAPVTEVAVDPVAEINEVFETEALYSTHRLDSSLVEEFLSVHPEFQADSTAIRAFYARRDFQYAWFIGDTLAQSAVSFFDLVSSVDTNLRVAADLRGELYHTVRDLLDNGRGRELGEAQRRDIELRLTGSFYRFAELKYGGFIRSDLKDLSWLIPRRKKDVDRLLDSLVTGRMDLSPVEPLHPQYKLLKDHLKRYYEMADAEWPMLDLADKRKWVLNDTGAGIAALRHRLQLLGDVVDTTSSARFDSVLYAGVVNFQLRHGLKPDGVVGKDFIKQVNIPPAERLRTLLVNMERLRWVAPEQPSDLLLVNIPEFRLHVYSADTITFSMDVVVGSTATRTVIFSDSLSRIVFSPTWTVPTSIVRGEILPALKKNSGYLARKNMELVDASGRVVPPGSVDWDKYTKGIPYAVRQKPGPSNSLGLVKFLFPNPYSIYMHDTPAKEKFQADRRAFSHGCIRLSDPPGLAEYLLRNDSTWTPAAIRKAMNGGKEVNVNLQEKVPVVIGYFTAWVDRQGSLNFRDDVYGHDARMAAELFSPPVPDLAHAE